MFSNFRKLCNLLDNVEKYCRGGQVTNDNMAHTRGMMDPPPHTHTRTHTDYVILTAFPLSQWLHERSSMLRYTDITFLLLL